MILVKWRQDLARRTDSLGYTKPQRTGNQWRWQVDVDIILFEPVFVPNLDTVAKTACRQQRNRRTLSFDQQICGECRAINYDINCAGPYGCIRQHLPHPVEYTLLRVVPGGQGLGYKLSWWTF